MDQRHAVAPIAARIIEKCGGARRVSILCGRTEQSVHRWRWSKARGGTGGLVPSDAAQMLWDAGQKNVVPIVADDFFCDPSEYAREPPKADR